MSRKRNGFFSNNNPNKKKGDGYFRNNFFKLPGGNPQIPPEVDPNVKRILIKNGLWNCSEQNATMHNVFSDTHKVTLLVCMGPTSDLTDLTSHYSMIFYGDNFKKYLTTLACANEYLKRRIRKGLSSVDEKLLKVTMPRFDGSGGNPDYFFRVVNTRRVFFPTSPPYTWGYDEFNFLLMDLEVSIRKTRQRFVKTDYLLKIPHSFEEGILNLGEIVRTELDRYHCANINYEIVNIFNYVHRGFIDVHLRRVHTKENALVIAQWSNNPSHQEFFDTGKDFFYFLVTYKCKSPKDINGNIGASIRKSLDSKKLVYSRFVTCHRKYHNELGLAQVLVKIFPKNNAPVL